MTGDKTHPNVKYTCTGTSTSIYEDLLVSHIIVCSGVYSCYVESKTIITLGLLSDPGHTLNSAPIPFYLEPKIIDTLTHDG